MRLNIRADGFRDNPYPIFERLRREAPICEMEPEGFIAVSRYVDVLTVLKDPKRFRSSGFEQIYSPIPEAARPLSMLVADPPNHGRLRTLVSKGFTPDAISRLEPRIRAEAKRLIARISDHGGDFDFVNEFSVPLPVAMIAEIIGISPERRDDFKRWTDDLFSVVNGLQYIPDPQAREQRRQTVIASAQEMIGYFESILAERTKQPGTDLVSLLIRASENEQRLSGSEVVDLLRLLLVAGNETTTGTLTNGMLALLQNPEQWDLLQSEPERIPALVEEALRYDTPLQILLRQVTEDTTLAGVSLAAGRIVALFIGSANHDADRFEDPERFDITRDANGHLAFGYGIHHCLGAALARLQIRVAFEELVAAFPSLQLVSVAPFERVESAILRGLKSLTIAIPQPSDRPSERPRAGFQP